jgi:hypothetical protein
MDEADDECVLESELFVAAEQPRAAERDMRTGRGEKHG